MSIFNKFEHVLNLLDSQQLDLISLSEVKLDENVPDKLCQHKDYNLKRHDRSIHGGGLLVYVRKCYKITHFPAYEIFSFKLNIKNIENNFVYAYKTPKA